MKNIKKDYNYRFWFLCWQLGVFSAKWYDVTVFEKNATIGGRARQLKKDRFTFDMGPSWYWMPDVFERFFADFEKKQLIIMSL
jgi:phytoene desaturase